MINLQDFIGNTKFIKQMKVDELLFVEFKCPMEDEITPLWCHNNFFAFVMTGETMIETPQNKYYLKPGDCAFAKKGSFIVHSDIHEDFCELLVFVPDEFIRTVMQKHKIPLSLPPADEKSESIIPLQRNEVLTTYFQSLFLYFTLSDPPTGSLLKLRFEELVVNIATGGNYFPLKYYFGNLCASLKPSIREIMEANFTQELSLQDFARLCARSLSSFKSEFNQLFHTSPGKWLRERRLEHSRYLLETRDDPVDEIAYASGFKNKSHFIRVFKDRYGRTPGQVRIRHREKIM
ncbi:MAG: helix-turn-helix transcriptional regulator [Bacteroidales bacterium]|nr:helix-turn-helix transcriptional regulator [Bacteroidales bacterium]